MLIKAPFRPEIVERLIDVQKNGPTRLTCPRIGQHWRENDGILVPWEYGLYCPYEYCHYSQLWAFVPSMGGRPIVDVHLPED